MFYKFFKTFFVLSLILQFGLIQNVKSDEISGAKRYDTDFQEKNIETFGMDHSKVIALTFDDGPGAGTEQILNTLKRYKIKATFFVLGQQIKSHPALARRIVSEGHVMGNHSYTHPDLREGKYTEHPELLTEELMNTHEAMKPYLRPDAKLFFRAPYAAWKPQNAEILNSDPELRKYVGPICWDVGRDVEWDSKEYTNAADWECWGHKNPLSEKACGDAYLHKLRELGGGVVLMHDIHIKTADMLDLLLPQLIAEGFIFKTLDELPELENYPVGSGSRVARVPPSDSSLSPYKGRCLPTHRADAKIFSKPPQST